jgi:ABC transporter substrate binding protein (PQQ-dependent alcohol dehydrogenase system)
VIRISDGVRRLVTAGAILFCAALTPASAQEIPMFDKPVRIGVLLPEENPAAGPFWAEIAKAAREGTIATEEDFVFNAELVGMDFKVLTKAPVRGDVVAAAQRLIDEGAFAVMGGYTNPEARALGAWAEQKGIPFINIGASGDSLRNEQCYATTFHLEPSAAMYLDSIVGWYVRSGLRQWYFVVEDSDEGRAQYERVRWSIQERHFGAREVGRMNLRAGTAGGANLAAAVRRANADVVILLQSAEDQLVALRDLDAGGIPASVQVTGYPHVEAQTRAFYAASRAVAPTLGVGHRAAAWEATIDAYGAREYNARYRERWGVPMETTAWAVYHAMRTLYEAAFFNGGATDAKSVMRYLMDPASVFDLHKGVATSFRPWDRQQRQSLYLIKINSAERATNLMNEALLVGELPAIYMPGTVLVERLDQIGDLANRSRCRKATPIR